MAATIDELIENPVAIDSLSVSEFGSVYNEMESKPFAERSADDIALSSMLETKKIEIINSSASKLSELSKEDLASLRSLVGNAVQISGVEVDLDALKGDIDKAIEDINAYENSNQSIIDRTNNEPVNPADWKDFVMFNELSADPNKAAEQLNTVDNIALLRMLPHCKPEVTRAGLGIQSEDVRDLVYNEVNRRLGYAAENMDTLGKNDIKWLSEMAADEYVAKNSSNMMNFANAYQEKMSALESNSNNEHQEEVVQPEPVVEVEEPIALETEEVLRDRRKQELLDALAAYEASDYEDAELHNKSVQLVNNMSEDEINNLKADLEASGNEDALIYLKGILDEIELEDENDGIENEHQEEVVQPEPVVEVEEPIALETEEVLRDRRKQELLDALAAYEASDYEDAELHNKSVQLVNNMSEDEINNLKADLEASGNEDALIYLKGILDEIKLEDEKENSDVESTDTTDDTTDENDDEKTEESSFNRAEYLKSLEKQDLQQLLVTVKAVKKIENNEEQLKATEDFIVSKASDVNSGKKLMTDPREWYQFRDVLTEFNDDPEKTNPEIKKALDKVNTDIRTFEEEYGLDANNLQSPEQVKINQEEIQKLSGIDFFDTIDKPVNKPWSDKEVEDWKKGAITPTLQGFAGALRNKNLSDEDKAKILERAKASLSQIETVQKDPKAYGDIALVVSELQKAYPEDGAVKEANQYLNGFIEKRGGKFLYPQMEEVSKKLDQLKIKGDLNLFNRKDIKQDGPDSEIAKLKELARIETETYLANITPPGTQITPEMFASEYEARLNKAIVSVVQADCTSKDKNQEEINQILNDLDKGRPVNINQTSLIGYYVAKGAKGMAAADILGKNPSFKDIARETKSKFAAFDEKCTKKYGEKYTVAKNILKSFAWGAAFGLAASVGPVAVAAVATASFANQAYGIYKDFKIQKAKAATEGKKFSFWKDYARNNKLRMAGAFLSASTVAFSGLSAVGVTVAPIIMTGKAGTGIALAIAGASKQAAKSMAAVKEWNQKNPDNKKSTLWAGLKAFGISAMSFGAGYLGGQAAGTVAGTVLHHGEQSAISTTTPTVEQTAEQTVQTPTVEQTVQQTVQTPTVEQTGAENQSPYKPFEPWKSDWLNNSENTQQPEEYRPAPLLPEDMVQDVQSPTVEQTVEQTVQTPTIEQTVQTPTVEQTVQTPTVEQTVQTPTVEQTGAENQSSYKPFEPWKSDWSNNSESTQQPEEYRPAPLLPEDMTYDANGTLIKIPEGMQLDENGNLVNIPATPEVSVPEVAAKDIEFWNNRANQFLGKETTESLYSRIDSGEIKLPEGIESKQEFAYKLAMSMEQSPTYVADALGINFQNSAQLEAQIQSMTPEQFAKLGDLMNDYGDRGTYIGDKPFETTNVNTPNQQTPTQQDLQSAPQEMVNPQEAVAPQQEVSPTPQPVVQPQNNEEQAQIVYPQKPHEAPIIDQHPVHNDGFTVEVSEEGRMNVHGIGADNAVFEDAARNLVGSDNANAIKDMRFLLQQAAIIQDIDQQIADGANFNEQQLAQIELYKASHLNNLSDFSDKYGVQTEGLADIANNVISEQFAATQPDIVQDNSSALGTTTDLTTIYESDIYDNKLDPVIQQKMLDTANEYAAPLNALVENGQATHEHFEKQGLSVDYYKVGEETYHISRDTGAHSDGSINITHTNSEGVTTSLTLNADGTSMTQVDRPNEPSVVTHIDANGNVIKDNPTNVVYAEAPIQAPVTGIDIVQPSVEDQWLPGNTMNDFVERLHNLSSEIRENDAMLDNSNMPATPKINMEAYETDIHGTALNPEVQQDIIDTATTYGRRLDAMVEHGYGTREHFEERGWSTDRYTIGGETFEISRDTGANSDGRLVISHDDGNGTRTSTYLNADGTSMTQVDRTDALSVITHRDAAGNIINPDTGQTVTPPVQEQDGQSTTVPTQEQEGQTATPRLNLKDEYLKDVKDLGLENPRSLSLHATEQRTSANGTVSGYSTYARFDRCDNGYSATNHDGALGLVFDDKGNGVFKISENDTVRPMTFEEAQSFVKTISIIDGKADVVKLTEALYENNHEAYALNEAKLNGLSGDITTLAVGDGMVAFSDNGVSITFDGRSYHAVLDESGKIVETSSMMGTKVDGINSESMRESLQLVAEKNPETSIAKAFAALSGEQKGTENVPQQDVVIQPAQDGRPPVEGESLTTYKASYSSKNYDGIATVTDKNGNVVFSQEFDVKYVAQGSSLLPTAYIDENGKVHAGATEYKDVHQYNRSESLVRHKLGVVLGEDKIYQDLAAKETITPGEEAFMKSHEQHLDKWGLTHDENGNVVRAYSCDMTRNNDGVTYNFDKDGLHIQKDGGLSEIKAEDKVYLDLKERQENGDKLGLLEKQFMNTHEQELIDQHMYHNAKGNLVQLPEGVNVTRDGAAYRISSNIVAENSAYGLNQQDYLSDAKSLLDSAMRAKDQLAVKSFLMNDDIYADLKHRIDSGEQFSASESKAISTFMENHEVQEQLMAEKYGIVRGEDGEMYKSQTQSQTNDAPKKVMIGRTDGRS